MCAFERSGVTRTAVIVTKPTRGSFTLRWMSSPTTSLMLSPTRWVLLVDISVLPRGDVDEVVEELDPIVTLNETLDLAQHLLRVERGGRDAADTDRRALPLLLVVDLGNGDVELRAQT